MDVHLECIVASSCQKHGSSKKRPTRQVIMVLRCPSYAYALALIRHRPDHRGPSAPGAGGRAHATRDLRLLLRHMMNRNSYLHLTSYV